MILCLDGGNTRLKWGLLADGCWRARGAQAWGAPPTLPAAPARIVACNVAGGRGLAAIEALRDRWRCPLEWFVTREAACGVINGYEQPGQLGADRWAALIGARDLHAGAALVVNCGTATTIDVLQADGRFAGGLILPGLELMREALYAAAAELPAARGTVVALPRNTFDGMASGALFATVGAIERMFDALAGEPDALCLLSGGAAPALLPWLSLPHRSVDGLVLEGLRRHVLASA